MGARTKARKRALDVIFEAEQRDLDLLDMLAERVAHPGVESALPQYAVELVEGYDAHARHIDEILETYSNGWTLERMPSVDRNLARLAIYELDYTDTPPAAVISEAVRLAGDLSTDDSPAFLNGLLSKALAAKPTTN